jgi:TonB family protein
MEFAINEGGRAHSIAQRSVNMAYQSDDIAPALAASRFATGQAATGCTVTYTNAFAIFDAAPLPELVSYSVNQHSGRLPREAWRRIEAGADCFANPRPQQLLRAYPDFGKIPGTPGVRDWSLVSYDTDASGRPVRPIMKTGTGNRALDAASITAVSDSRFTGGARAGCLYPYYRNAVVLTAPTMPEKPVEPAGCARRDAWQAKPVLVYPPAYSRRAIEGWAVIRYDIAPWGAIGNVSVVEAQPSADFGAQAKRMLESARAKPSEMGAQNCVVHVRYAMGRPASEFADAAAEAIY